MSDPKLRGPRILSAFKNGSQNRPSNALLLELLSHSLTPVDAGFSSFLARSRTTSPRSLKHRFFGYLVDNREPHYVRLAGKREPFYPRVAWNRGPVEL